MKWIVHVFYPHSALFFEQERRVSAAGENCALAHGREGGDGKGRLEGTGAVCEALAQAGYESLPAGNKKASRCDRLALWGMLA